MATVTTVETVGHYRPSLRDDGPISRVGACHGLSPILGTGWRCKSCVGRWLGAVCSRMGSFGNFVFSGCALKLSFVLTEAALSPVCAHYHRGGGPSLITLRAIALARVAGDTLERVIANGEQRMTGGVDAGSGWAMRSRLACPRWAGRRSNGLKPSLKPPSVSPG